MLPKRIFAAGQLVSGPGGQLQLQAATSDFPANLPADGSATDLSDLTEPQLMAVYNAYGLAPLGADATSEQRRNRLQFFLSFNI